jgi:integrase
MARRRGNGEGSITRHKKSGLYMARYTAQTSTGPKRMTIYGKKREDVAEKLAKALSDRANGLNFGDENVSVGEFITRWLEDSAKGNLAPRTYHNYRLQLRRHIVPALGKIKLKGLSPAHVQGLYAAKLRAGMKPSSVRYIHAVLHRSLEQAVRWNMLPRNPAASVDPPKVRHEEIIPLDANQARIFLEAAKGDRFEALYVLSLTVGLRMGEALGLRWSDIDLGAGTLRVNRQLQRIRDGGGLVFSEPKSASRRTVDLPQRAVEALRNHRKRQIEEKMKAIVYEDSGSFSTPPSARRLTPRT